MTEPDSEESADRATMGDVSHTNPFTGDTFGGVYRRGPAVTDGGESAHAVESSEPPNGGTDDTASTTGDSESASDDSASTANATMGDVDHTPPYADVNDVWSRGHRGSGVPEHR